MKIAKFSCKRYLMIMANIKFCFGFIPGFKKYSELPFVCMQFNPLDEVCIHHWVILVLSNLYLKSGLGFLDEGNMFLSCSISCSFFKVFHLLATTGKCTTAKVQ